MLKSNYLTKGANLAQPIFTFKRGNKKSVSMKAKKRVLNFPLQIFRLAFNKKGLGREGKKIERRRKSEIETEKDRHAQRERE